MVRFRAVGDGHPQSRRHAPRCRSRREKTTCRPPGAKLSRPAPPRVGVARSPSGNWIDIVVIAGCGSSPVGTARSARRCRRSGSERRSAEQFDDAGGEQRPAYRLAGRARPGDVLVPLLEPAFCVAAGYDAPARDFGHTTSHAFASHPGRDGVSTRANIKRPMVVRGKLLPIRGTIITSTIGQPGRCSRRDSRATSASRGPSRRE